MTAEDSEFFPGFVAHDIDAGDVVIHAVVGGSGPPVLLLHGYPQTHVCWHLVAPVLARRGFTVVAADLRGYGASGKPRGDEAHERYSKRAMARDAVALMRALGHERFHVVGHDRGGRVAYRLALDHPGVALRVAVLDIIPTVETFERFGTQGAMNAYHWFFLAQPTPMPETLIAADPTYYLDYTIGRWSGSPLDARAMDAYRRAWSDPATVHAACEDYRAGATFDRALDAEDRAAGRTIAAPFLVLWGHGPTIDPNSLSPLEIWRAWAPDIRGRGLPCGHFLAEEAPDEVAGELEAFLR